MAALSQDVMQFSDDGARKDNVDANNRLTHWRFAAPKANGLPFTTCDLLHRDACRLRPTAG